MRLALKWSAVVVLLASLAATADVQSDVQSALRSAKLGNTEMSLIAIDLTDQKVLLNVNADVPLIPASNMKLLTAAAALDVLGPDYTFKTKLELIPAEPAKVPGETDDVSLPSLLVVGDGDPAFGDPGLLSEHNLNVEQIIEQWVAVIVKTGANHFETLYIDDRVFDQDFVHDTWPKDQLNRWYCAEVAGINFHTNCLDLLPSPAPFRGAAPTVEIHPNVGFIEIDNRARTGPKDTFWISRRHDANDFVFHGSVKHVHTKPVHVTFHDPPMFFGRLLQERLAAHGIRVDRVQRVAAGETFPTAVPLHVFQTTMPIILERVNQDSQNMYAESLFKRIGHEVTGQPGSWLNGEEAVRSLLRTRVGMNANTAKIADGSGMSRSNRVASRHLATLLESVYGDDERWPVYRNSLAKAGASGTLANRLADLPYDIYGKTGYINAVSSLSGYLIVPGRNDDDEPQRVIAFSLLFNNYRHPIYTGHIKNMQDRIVRELAEYAQERTQQPVP